MAVTLVLALFHASNNRSEVVIQKNHVRGVLGYWGSCNTHRNTNISFFEGRAIVDAIACYCYNMSYSLTVAHYN